jgi:serine/threonine protein kinase
MSDSSSGPEPLELLAEEFLERRRRGERPTVTEYAARHPELADAIHAVFKAMAIVADLGPDEDPVALTSNSTETEQMGDFRIIREIGRGGMGVVYEALQLSLGRRVALKLQKGRIDVKQRSRFDREARAAARLHHTNIVPVFGFGLHEGTPYYAMQYIEGRGLDTVVQELVNLTTARGEHDRAGNRPQPPLTADPEAAEVARSLCSGNFRTMTRAGPSVADGTSVVEGAGCVDGDATTDLLSAAQQEPRVNQVRADRKLHEPSDSTLTRSRPGKSSRGRAVFWREVARVGAQVADALAYAHAQGVIHRDIKPSNLLLDAHGMTWVADFGLAKADDSPSLTETGDVLGTLRYMPPEAFEGKADARGDVYSLGLTLYELLALRPAFDEADRGQLIRAVTMGMPPRLRVLKPDVPRDLETIVHKAIEHEQLHRYATAGALAEDLRRFIDDRPILARRVSETEKLWRWCRRNPLPGALATAFVLALLVGGMGSAYYAVREARANVDLRDSVDRERQQLVLAMDAIRTFHTGVGEDFLLKEPRFKSLRDRQLKSAADFYGRLAGLLSGHSDLPSRRALGQANFELAGKVGRKEDALSAHRRVLAYRQQLTSEARGNADTIADLGRSMTAVGELHEAIGQIAEAESTYRAADARMVAASATPAVRSALGDCRGRLGRLLGATGRDSEALEVLGRARADQESAGNSSMMTDAARAELARTIHAFGAILAKTKPDAGGLEALRTALAIRKELADNQPTDAQRQLELATSHDEMANASFRGGNTPGALHELQASLPIRSALAAAYPGNTEIQSQLAACHHELGNALSDTGAVKQALSELRAAMAIWEGLAAADPADIRFQQELGTAQLYVGMALSRAGDLSEGLRQTQGAQTILARLAAANPGVTAIRNTLAFTHFEVGDALTRMGDTDGAVQALSSALLIIEKLAAGSPADTKFQNNVAACHLYIGYALLEAGDAASSLRELRSARAIDEKLAASHPHVRRVKSSLAGIQSDIGVALSRVGDQSAALLELRAALKTQQELAEGSPDDSHYDEDLATTRTHIATALLHVGDVTEALRELHTAQSITVKLASAHPHTIKFQVELARILARTGECQRRAGLAQNALKSLRQAMAIRDQITPRGAMDLYEVARYQSLLAGVARDPGSGMTGAGAQVESDRAMGTLNRAVKAGYRSVIRLQTEADLDPIRDRPDFQVLVSDVAFPTKPFVGGTVAR